MQRMLRPLRSRIRNKIIIPYLLLAVLVTMLGAFLAFFLVAGSLQERLELSLRQSALKTSEALVDFEDQQLAKLRIVAYNGPNIEDGLPGTAEAYARDDGDSLRSILGNALRYYRMSQLVSFDMSGTVIAEQRSPELETRLPVLTGSSLQRLIGVQYILRNQLDLVDGKVADKYSSLVLFEAPSGEVVPLLYTVVPVVQPALTTGGGKDKIVGGLLAAEPLGSVLELVAQRNDAFYTVIYDSQGRPLESNAGQGEAQLAIPPDTLQALQSLGNPEVGLRTEQVDVNKRSFLIAYSPLRIRERIDGYFAVAIEQSSVFNTWLPTRNVIVVLTLVMLAAVFAVGNWISRRITLPLQEVADTASAIALGQLEKRSAVRSEDEVGTLSSVLNQMTDRLLDLYLASRQLGSELELSGILRSTDIAVQRLVPDAGVAAILSDEGSWTVYLPGGEEGWGVERFAQEELDNMPPFLEGEVLRSLIEEPVLRALQVTWALPLRTQQRSIGLLLICGAEDVDWAPIREPLIAIASMTATSLQNGLLYHDVEQEAGKNRAILQSIADGVVVCDTEGRVVLANAAAFEMLGLQEDDLYGRPFAALPLARLQQGPDFFAGGAQQQLYEINQRTLSMSVSPVISFEARVEGKVVILHDVTAQHELEQARTTFIATISHELRTPLTPILGYLDLLFQPALAGPLTENQEMFLTTIRKNAKLMNDLLGNVILIARIEAGAAASRPTELRLGPVLDDVMRPLLPELESKELAFEQQLPPDLPSICADPEHIRIVLSKVLDNACRYTSAGKITVRATVVRRQVEILIEDTGPGMAREDLERIFTRFSRGGEQAGLAGESRGAGLGLSIARRLIDQQGGSISLTSEVGSGTICTIRIPMEEHAARTEDHEIKLFAAED